MVLRAVDRHGGVVGAAEFLRVSPSAISQQLAALERDIGVALIDRSRRGGQRPVELSAAGRRLAGHAAQLVQVLDDAEADMAGFAGAAVGPVTIAAFFTILSGYVGPALTRLARAHPGIRVRVLEMDEPEVLPDLHAGTVDLVFVEDDAQHRRRPPAGLRYEALLDDPFRMAVPVDWPDVADLTDVAVRPWVDGPPGSALGQALARLRRTTGMEFPAAHHCTGFTAALAVAGAGLAGALIPDLALAVALPEQGVRIITPAGIGSRRLGVLYRQSRHEPTPALRAVLEVLRSATVRRAPSAS